jgi:hypothetical protein
VTGLQYGHTYLHRYTCTYTVMYTPFRVRIQIQIQNKKLYIHFLCSDSDSDSSSNSDFEDERPTLIIFGKIHDTQGQSVEIVQQIATNVSSSGIYDHI